MAKGPTDGLNPYEMASGAHSGAGNIYSNLASGGPNQFYDQYQNPYQQDVINATTQDMMRNRDLMLGQTADAAIRNDAFGGDRYAIENAVTNAEVNQNIADMGYNMRHAGFNNAMGMSQNHFGQMQGLAGDASNYGNNMMNIGNMLTDRQAAAGTQAQATNQSIMDAAQGIHGQSHPLAWLSNIQGAIAGNPLAAESTTTQAHNPGMLESIGGGLSIGSSIVGK